MLNSWKMETKQQRAATSQTLQQVELVGKRTRSELHFVPSTNASQMCLYAIIFRRLSFVRFFSHFIFSFLLCHRSYRKMSFIPFNDLLLRRNFYDFCQWIWRRIITRFSFFIFVFLALSSALYDSIFYSSFHLYIIFLFGWDGFCAMPGNEWVTTATRIIQLNSEFKVIVVGIVIVFKCNK